MTGRRGTPSTVGGSDRPAGSGSQGWVDPGASAGGASGRTTAGRLGRLKVLAVVVLLAVLGSDLATKAWMGDLLGLDPEASAGTRRVEVIPGFFALEGTLNAGVTFGLAQGRTTAILVFTFAATLGLALWTALTPRASRLLHVALAMVLGGALGNLYDRLHWGRVRDFLLFYVGEAEWPNFNIADSCIVIGVGLIVWDELFGARRKAASEAKEPSRATG